MSANDTVQREDGVNDYLRQIGDHRLLSREEEVELFQRCEAGDAAAREEIVSCNLRFVVKIALQYQGCGLPLADLIQEGNVGLLMVVDKFDWRRGYRFSTYAAFWIRQEIQAALRRRGNLIALPVRKARLLGRINDVMRKLTTRLGREPQTDEIAAEIGVPVERIDALMPFRDCIVSLEEELSPDGGTLLDSIEATNVDEPRARIQAEQQARVVQGVLRYLNPREREVVEHRYGLGENSRSLSLRKTSRIVGLSQEGVRRVERRALDKLQRPAISRQLSELMIA